MSDENFEKELRVTLKKIYYDMIEEIRDFRGIEDNANLIRFIIKKEFRSVKKEQLELQSN